MIVIFPIIAGISTWSPTAVPGDIVALSLQIPPGGGTTTVTTTVGGAGATTTVRSISTSAVGGVVNPTLFYVVGAVAAVFVIATDFLAMRTSRKPAP